MSFWNKKKDEPKKKKGKIREWLDALVFAVVVATLIRTFLIEAYVIPTPSMEGSLLVNDFLFVSKMHYGPRIPMTPVAIPFVHNVNPLTGGRSYSTAVQWKYKRLPGISKIERNDDVVFNYPADDMEDGKRPVDKKENYIKRCVGLPGDKLEVRDGVVYINDKIGYQPKHLQHLYQITSSPSNEVLKQMEDGDLPTPEFTEKGEMTPYIYADAHALKQLKNVGIQLVEVSKKTNKTAEISTQAEGHSIWPISSTRRSVDSTYHPYNKDWFGPIVLPKRGVTVQLTDSNIALYYDVITKYEGHKLDNPNGQFIIDGKPVTTYTFQDNYYWLMGDNRDNSLDSRYWGYVPETHIVGKAWFVWLSFKKNLLHPRLGRMFRSVKALENK
jgi:signal peptidase I